MRYAAMVEDLSSVMKRLLGDRHMSQATFAKAMGRSKSWFTKIKTGKRNPPWKSWEKWSAVLRLNRSDRAKLRDAMAIAAAPPRARDIIASLEKRLSKR